MRNAENLKVKGWTVNYPKKYIFTNDHKYLTLNANLIGVSQVNFTRSTNNFNLLWKFYLLVITVRSKIPIRIKFIPFERHF